MKKYLYLLPALLVLLLGCACVSSVLAANAPSSSPSQHATVGDIKDGAPAVATSSMRPAQQPTDIEAVKKDMVETFSSHVSLMSYGFGVLGVFTGILALGGIFITFLSSRLYRSEIREKKATFEKGGFNLQVQHPQS